MTAMRFNPLTYARNLHASGVNQETADIIAQQQADIISNMMANDLAKKEDIEGIKKDLLSLELRLSTLIVKSSVGIGGVIVVLMAIFKFLPK